MGIGLNSTTRLPWLADKSLVSLEEETKCSDALSWPPSFCPSQAQRQLPLRSLGGTSAGKKKSGVRPKPNDAAKPNASTSVGMRRKSGSDGSHKNGVAERKRGTASITIDQC